MLNKFKSMFKICATALVKCVPDPRLQDQEYVQSGDQQTPHELVFYQTA